MQKHIHYLIFVKIVIIAKEFSIQSSIPYQSLQYQRKLNKGIIMLEFLTFNITIYIYIWRQSKDRWMITKNEKHLFIKECKIFENLETHKSIVAKTSKPKSQLSPQQTCRMISPLSKGYFPMLFLTPEHCIGTERW